MNWKQWIAGVGVMVGVMVSVPSLAGAQSITVRPFLIDQSVEPRDIINENILITNTTGRKLNVYATVNEITLDTNGEVLEYVPPMSTDRKNTITSWVEVTRGRIEIEPFGSTTVPVMFRVHPQAASGEYHMFLGFVPASKRFQAEAVAREGKADGVVVSLSIDDQKVEAMRVRRFVIDRFVTNEDEREYLVELQNEGDLPLIPRGEIIFYDTKGMEIDAIAFNEATTPVPPGEARVFTGALPFAGELGRYKANLNLNYGERQRANLFDTTSFYLMPWYTLLAIFSAILIVAILVALLVRRAIVSEREEEEAGDDIPMFVKAGHEANQYDHDIDLKNPRE